MVDPSSPTPLKNILVADFSRVLAGPFATMTLGDLGADVVKVERPGIGDDTRQWGPPWLDGQSTYYLGLNRNKRSAALDLKDPKDLKLATTLALRADIVIDSFRPGLMESWGLDGDTLRERNPKLISCSITAFGSHDRAATLPGYDLLLQAMGGLMSLTGEPDGKPVKVPSAVIDLVCGLLAVVGIQAALVERESTGRGRHVESSLIDSALTSLLNLGSAWVTAGVLPQRLGNHHPSIAPYATYQAADKPFALAVGNDRLFVRLCESIGMRELIKDKRFATNSARVANLAELEEKLEAHFRTQPANYWIDLLQAAHVPVGPINNVAEAFKFAEEIGLHPIAHTDGLHLQQPPLKFDAARPPIQRQPPKLDEHGEEIRAWLAEDIG